MASRQSYETADKQQTIESFTMDWEWYLADFDRLENRCTRLAGELCKIRAVLEGPWK